MTADPTLDDLLNKDEVEALFRPTAVAQGLPARAYLDDRFWEIERARFFARTWLACAFESDVPGPGSAFPVSFGGWELIVTRDQDGQIRAFHNVCRHRAMRVLDKPCRDVRTLTCPWHAWTYDLAGHLLATPGIGGPRVDGAEGFACGELGLVPVRCDTWMGFVLVNPDGKAPALMDHLAAIRGRLSDYDFSLLRSAGSPRELEYAGNWKLVVEGGVENYHLPWVHPESGGHQGITREDFDETGSYVGIASRWPNGGPEAEDRRLPVFPHLAGDPPGDGLGWEDKYLFLLPCTVVEVMDDHVVAGLFLPLAKDRTLLRRAIYFVGDDAMGEDLAQVRESVCRFWHRIGEQDSPLVGRLQKQQALRAELSLPTRFAPHWESAVHRFQKLVVARLR